MLKSIFIFIVSVVGIPIYAVCVVFLLVIGTLFGWSYVDASVYICEYSQPLITALLALCFLISAIRNTLKVFNNKSSGVLLLLSAICLIYISIITYCTYEFIHRVIEYSGMTNPQIFDFVVQELSKMGDMYPKGRINLFTGESISYGYIMANMEVYILPISIVLLCGLIQWRIGKRMKISRQ